MTTDYQEVTRNYIRYCYTCDKAHECDTEEQCVACWRQKEQLQTEEMTEETRQALRQYAE